jgi:hypothetical protein
MRSRIRTAATLLLSVVLFLTACGGSDGSATSPTSAPTVAAQRPSTGATLAIASPQNGETVNGNQVTVKLELDGGTIASTSSTELVPDEGHVHVVLDDQLISMTSDLTYVIPDVAPGMHLLKVEFVANDHAPFDPRVIAAVSFEVAP